jgi:hypothetical protein
VGQWLSSVIKQDDASKKILFLLSLLTYTEQDQVGIALKGDSASGKSWIALRIAELHPGNAKVTLSYASPTAFFHETGTLNPVTNVRTIDYERKLLVFLDMPNAELLKRLRPLLSHDQKQQTYKVTDRTQKSGYRTKEAILKGYFTTVFCSADSIYDEQERTRLVMLSPSDDPEKIKEAILLKAAYEKDPEAFKKTILADAGLQILKQRIDAIHAANIRYVKIPSAEKIGNDFIAERLHLSPRHTRDFPRLLYLIKANAVLNFANRGLDANHDITVNDTDIQVGKKLYAAICESNELGLDPSTYEIWTTIIQPLLVRESTASRIEIATEYYQIKHRNIGDRKLRSIMTQLQTTGLVNETVDQLDRKTKVYKLVVSSGTAAKLAPIPTV